MARTYDPPTPLLPLAIAAGNGALAAWGALLCLSAFATLGGGSPWVPANALGAWFVRWLQTADPTATTRFYADATLGGILLSGVAGALGGMFWWACLTHWRGARPLVLAVLLALVGLGLVRRIVAPALDPLMLRDLPGLVPWWSTGQDWLTARRWPGLHTALWRSGVWWAAAVVYGLLLGLGFQLDRRRSYQEQGNGSDVAAAGSV